jgi:phage-related protein
MATVAQLDVRIGADIKSFQQGMAKLENQLKQVGSNLRNTGRQLTTAITLPLVGIGAAAVKAASDAEEMQSKFNTVFKTVGGDVTKQLDAFARASGRSRYELQGMAGQLGDIFKPLGYTEQQAGNLSVQVAKLAVDLGSFNNMPMDEALARLRGTLVGSHENALAFGVVINEASLKQELMRMGADKLTGAQLNQAKVQARLNLLMAGTTDAQGDAIRTSDSFANQFQRLRNATYDLGVTIGELLLPYASELVSRLQGMVDFVQNLNPETKKLGIILAGVAAAAGPLVFTLGGMASGFSAIMRAVTLTMGLFNPYVAGLAAVAAIFVGLTRGSDSVQAAFKTFGDQITTSFAPAWETLKTAVSTAYEQFIGWWDTNGETVKTTLATTFAGLITAIGGALGSIAELFTTAWDAAEDVTEAALGENGTLAGLISSGVANGINQLAASLALIASTVDTTLQQASGTIKTVTFGAKGKWSEAWEAFQGIPKSNIDAVLAFFDTIDTDITSNIDPNTGKDAADATMGEGEGKKSFGDRLRELLTEALGGFDAFKTGIADPLVNDADSVSNTLGDTEDDVTDLKNSVDGLFKIMPDNTTIIAAVQGVQTPTEEAKQAAEDFIDAFQATPEDLKGIEDTADAIKEIIPDVDEVSRFYQLQHAFGLLEEDFKDAADQSANLSHHFGNVEDTLTLLKVDKDSKFFKFVEGLRYAAEQTTIFLDGMQSLMVLLKAETWITFFNTIVGIVQKLGTLLGITSGAAAAGAGAAGGGITIGGGVTGVPPVTVPGIGAGAGAAGAGGGAGMLAGIPVATQLALAYVLGNSIYRLAGFGGSETPWVSMGITRDEWIQQQIASGGYATIAGNLMGGVDLSWLSGTAGGGSMNGAGTPTWLSGLQGYMGTGGSANTSGVMGSMGMTTGGQTINVNLDGQTIATATMPYWSQELEIYGTNR